MVAVVTVVTVVTRVTVTTVGGDSDDDSDEVMVPMGAVTTVVTGNCGSEKQVARDYGVKTRTTTNTR
jgi:hypothetical protein